MFEKRDLRGGLNVPARTNYSPAPTTEASPPEPKPAGNPPPPEGNSGRSKKGKNPEDIRNNLTFKQKMDLANFLEGQRERLYKEHPSVETVRREAEQILGVQLTATNIKFMRKELDLREWRPRSPRATGYGSRGVGNNAGPTGALTGRRLMVFGKALLDLLVELGKPVPPDLDALIRELEEKYG